MWFGDDDDSPLGLVAALAMVLLAPIAASIIQLAISRQREYAADAGGAEICGNPESLASALLRLEQGAEAMPMQVNQAAEPLYIVKPFKGKGIAGLFSTHPPIEERVRRLRQMRPSSAKTPPSQDASGSSGPSHEAARSMRRGAMRRAARYTF